MGIPIVRLRKVRRIVGGSWYYLRTNKENTWRNIGTQWISNTLNSWRKKFNCRSKSIMQIISEIYRMMPLKSNIKIRVFTLEEYSHRKWTQTNNHKRIITKCKISPTVTNIASWSIDNLACPIKKYSMINKAKIQLIIYKINRITISKMAMLK